MKLYLKIYFCLYAFVCQEIRKNSAFQDRGGSICNLNICLLADLTLLTAPWLMVSRQPRGQAVI